MKSNRGIRIIVAVISLILIVAYAFTMMTASEQTEDLNENLKSKDPLGYYIFIELLDRLGYRTAEWNNPEALPDTGTLVLLKPTTEYKIKNKTVLINWVKKGNTLVIAGISEALELLTGFKSAVINIDKDSEVWNVRNLENYSRSTLIYQSNRVFVDNENAVPYASNSYGVLAGARKEGEGEIILISEAVFLTNKSLESDQNADFVNAVLSRSYDKRIFYAGTGITLVAKAEGNPIIVLFKGRIKFVTIQILILIFMFYLAIGIRFGPPDLPAIAEQRFLKRHLAGLGGFFSKMNALFFVLEINQKYYRTRFLKFYSLPQNAADYELKEHMEKSIPGSWKDVETFFSSGNKSISDIIYLRNKMHKLLLEIKAKGRKDGI